MKVIKKIVVLFVVALIQNSLSAQVVNSVELIDVKKIDNINSSTTSKSLPGAKTMATQPLHSSIPDSTSVNMILPKQYDPKTMESKPE